MTNAVVAGFETRVLHTLAKVFPDEPLRAGDEAGTLRHSALANETYAFQIAYRSPEGLRQVQVKVDSPLAPFIRVRTVGLVPSELPCFPDQDDDVLRKTPGLYPDPLFPIGEDGIIIPPNQWRSLWVSVHLDGSVPAGEYPIAIKLIRADGEPLAEETVSLRVLSASLPPQRLMYTNWFHTDCLADYYGCDVFSERHWELIESFVRTAVEHGMNMLLTPIFTPPLDTAVGGERTTVQLVDVERTAPGEYRFGFSRLKRWIDLALASGIEYFEMSHLFTQWGAQHAPKIMASTENGAYERIFGWETDAAGPEYRRFLESFLPELVKFLKAEGIAERCWFHVSDEPHLRDLESYRKASGIVRELLPDFPVLDALSDFDFYKLGLVPRPVPASNHIEPFLEGGLKDLWTYYCCGQYKGTSNRFFNMPSARTRVLGLQLYKFDIAGFLHWGYNFYNTQYSLKKIDPYRVTDAGCAFPSGDAFIVYPGEDGPVESLRLELMQQAFQDLRALRLLEESIGRERTLALIEEGLTSPIRFASSPSDAAWLLGVRERINDAIAEACEG